MGLSHAPRVITDGLVLGLDAANTRSYVGSGTTWTDLIGSNNGTLTNGPVFTQEPKQEPFGGAGAVQFDGSGDYLSIPDSDDFNMGTGDFTLECWVNSSNNSDYQGIFGSYDYDNAMVLLQISNTGVLRFINPGTISQTGTTDLWDGGWHHIVMCRSGSTLRGFVNGKEEISTSYSASIDWGHSNNSIVIGIVDRTDYPGQYEYTGYISNLRLIKGRALYTSNFTPPRKKLEVTSDTVLLTCEKGTIRDRSSSAHAITVIGGAHLITGASYFEFDGTDDNCPLGPSADFTPGTGPFTIEMWIYPTATPSQYEGPAYYTGSGVNNTSLFWAYRSGNLDLINNGDSYTLLSMTYPTLNQWVHLVASRDTSGYFAVYENGVVKVSTTGNSDNYEQTEIYIGGSGAYKWPGKVSIYKMYKGKGLTAAEVTQNFNALRGRYGI